MQVKRIVNSFYNSNTFVLSKEGSTNVWLVDCGDYISHIRPFLKDKKIKGVLLTHTHSDHIYGLVDVLVDFPDVKIYTNDFGKEALSNPKLNVSKYHTEIPDLVIVCNYNTIIVKEGNKIELFDGIYANVLLTPGHDKSSISYVIADYLFTGDSYIPGERLLAIFPNSNKIDAIKSYNRLIDLSKNYTVCPGHGSIAQNYRGNY